MIRALQITHERPCPILTAGEAMTRGMVKKLTADGKLADAGTIGLYFVDVPKNFDGVNAAIEPNDAQFENIASGALVVGIPIGVAGERFATDQITGAGSLTAGDGLVVASGKFAAAQSSDTPVAYFVGAYADPDFTDMYEIVIG